MLENFERTLSSYREKWERHTDDNVPLHYDYPIFPLKYWFSQWAEETPEQPYIITQSIQISYREADNIACRLANALLKLGVLKGDRVAVMAPPCPEYILTFQALLKIGAIEVPTNERFTVPELKHRFQDSGAQTVIVPAMVVNKVLPFIDDPECPIKRVIVFQLESAPAQFDPQEGTYEWDAILQSADPSEPKVEVLAEDVARLQYTGGTTGVYKGCVLTNHMIFVQSCLTAMWYTSGYTVVKKEDVRTLCAIPLHHIYGFNANIAINIFTGGTIVLSSSAKPSDILNCLESYKPTLFASVPKMLMDLMEEPRFESVDFSSLKGIFCGSAPLPVAVIKRFEDTTGAIIAEGYGMSEATCTVTVNPLLSLRKPGSVGICRPDTDVLVVDSETGTKIMGPNELGEIIIRGATVIKEYWKNPNETAKAIRDGWLHTGDIGRFDEDGYLYINDRKHDIINRSGFKVYPREIEELVYTLPEVAKVSVIGVPDPKRGENVKAYIKLKDGESLTPEQIVTHCKQSLVGYKVPGLIEFIDEIPVTSVGKINRNELRARSAQAIKKDS